MRNSIFSKILLVMALVLMFLPLSRAEAEFGDFLFKFPEAPTGALNTAFDSEGNLYITDFFEHRVYVYASDGTFLRKWGEMGNGPGQLCKPRDIDVDSADNIYVLNDCSGVQVFTSDGIFLRNWSSFNWWARGMTIDADDNVYITIGGYISGSGLHSVYVYDRDGTLLRKWGGLGSGDGQFNCPTGIDIGPDGNVYVADQYNRRVQVFTRGGTFLRKWGGTDLSYDLEVNSAGNIYINGYHGIRVYTNDGSLLKYWREGGAIEIDSSDYVYVGSENAGVAVYTPGGAYVKTYGSGSMDEGQLHRPYDLEWDSEGNLYVAEPFKESISVFSGDGTYVREIEIPIGGYWHYGPWDFAFDSRDNIYAVDYLNDRVLVYSKDGTFLNQWGSSGTGEGQFRSPWGIEVDSSDNIYVLDYYNSRIQVFTPDGIYIRQFPVVPGKIAMDSAGNIYVMDWDKIRVYSNSGTLLREWGSVKGRFVGVAGIKLDNAGNVYTAETWFGRVEVYDNSGTFLHSMDVKDWRGTTRYTYLISLAVTPDGGMVYVGSQDKFNIQVYAGLGDYDTTPPVTTASLDGILGDNGWYISEVKVTLLSTDSCSGVKEIHYTLDSVETVTSENPVTFTITEDGVHTLSYWAVDNAGNVEQASSAPIYNETAPPVTTPTPSGTEGDNGNYTSCVVVDLDAVAGSSGVAYIMYSVNGGDPQVYEGSFTVCGDGDNTVSYSAVSTAGNVEPVNTIIIKIDQTPPTITATVVPPANANGWHNTDVTMTFSCDDDTSGIAECTAPVTVTTEGAGQVITGTAKDNAGNTASTSVTLDIDKTAPAITINGVEDGATYALGFVPQASYGVTDALSGVAASSDSLTGGDSLGLGTFTYTVTATDNAGNTAEKPYTYEVIATPAGTIAVINDLVASGQIDPNIAGSLLPKLEGAQSANTGTAADGKLQAFINQINAQVGKKITPEAAAILIKAAMYMMLNN